jgi:hypothetical protein
MWTAGLALCVATGSLTVANWDSIRPNHFPTQDDRAVMAVIRSGTALEFSLAGPPQAACGPLAPTVIRGMTDRAELLSRYFEGDALQSQQAQAAAALAGSERGCSQAGGLRGMNVVSVSVSGATAEARATIEAWDRVGQPQADGRVRWAQPQNALDYRFHLQRGGQGWRITAYSWVFAAGSGP